MLRCPRSARIDRSTYGHIDVGWNVRRWTLTSSWCYNKSNVPLFCLTTNFKNEHRKKRCPHTELQFVKRGFVKRWKALTERKLSGWEGLTERSKRCRSTVSSLLNRCCRKIWKKLTRETWWPPSEDPISGHKANLHWLWEPPNIRLPAFLEQKHFLWV